MSVRCLMGATTVLIFLLVGIELCSADGSDSLQVTSWRSPMLDSALSYIRLTRGDLSLRTDYVDRDTFRLPIVDYVMIHPLEMPDLLADYCDSVDVLLGAALAQESNEDSVDQTTAVSKRISGKLPDKLSRLLEVIDQSVDGYMSAANPLLNTSSEDSVFVVDSVSLMLRADISDAEKTPEQRDEDQRREERLASRLADLGAGLEWRSVHDNGRALARRVFTAVRTLQRLTDVRDWMQKGQIEWESVHGRVAIGTLSEDSYSGDYYLILDPGGNDRYELSERAPFNPQVIIDLGGDDRYHSTDGRGLGSGYFAPGLLFDLAGNDRYEAGSFSLGAGFFGVGILYDVAGDDTYSGDTYTLGAGGFGYGLLVDLNGRDRYDGALYAQGFGFAGGIGILSDGAGNDLYTAGGKYEDVLRYRDHYLSLSQGFAYGIRPYCSGGVGLLLDQEGNDIYVADIFGQGCSYWWGFGGLFDASGNDQYLAFQYAQGSATHLTAGCLYDVEGDDRYDAKGVSQGCGHDWSVALLIDDGGNDRYSATDLSQAAGSANGIGLLFDSGGDDVYTVTSSKNTQGYGNPRRQYGSIGVFLDLGRGEDRYLGPGGNDRIWIGGSKWGIGVDR